MLWKALKGYGDGRKLDGRKKLYCNAFMFAPKNFIQKPFALFEKLYKVGGEKTVSMLCDHLQNVCILLQKFAFAHIMQNCLWKYYGVVGKFNAFAFTHKMGYENNKMLHSLAKVLHSLAQRNTGDGNNMSSMFLCYFAKVLYSLAQCKTGDRNIMGWEEKLYPNAFVNECKVSQGNTSFARK